MPLPSKSWRSHGDLRCFVAFRLFICCFPPGCQRGWFRGSGGASSAAWVDTHYLRFAALVSFPFYSCRMPCSDNLSNIGHHRSNTTTIANTTTAAATTTTTTTATPPPTTTHHDYHKPRNHHHNHRPIPQMLYIYFKVSVHFPDRPLLDPEHHLSTIPWTKLCNTSTNYSSNSKESGVSPHNLPQHIYVYRSSLQYPRHRQRFPVSPPPVFSAGAAVL